MNGIRMTPQTREARFKFGGNRQYFTADLTPGQIAEGETSLSRLLGRNDLDGLSFLDIGCGSGLFSLAARNIGARVRSFDYDPDSVGGMDWHHDMHDYPYASAKAEAVKAHLTRRGFAVLRPFERPPGIGLFGTGCDEFVFQAQPASGPAADLTVAGSKR
jgi:2-polyprenyl-3-methyl-5-hydroxy-6-metoxy-1,4-benzoquinol methylase